MGVIISFIETKKLTPVLVVFISWSILVTLNFIFMRLIIKKITNKSVSSSLSYLCESFTQSEIKYLEKNGLFFSIITLLSVMFNVITQIILNSGAIGEQGDFANGVPIVFRILITIFSCLPSSISWLLPPAVFFTAFRSLSNSISIIQNKYSKSNDIINSLENIQPKIIQTNLIFGKLVSIALIFSGITLVFVAVALFRLVLSKNVASLYLFILIFWLILSFIYVLVILLIGSSVNASALVIIQNILNSSDIKYDSVELSSNKILILTAIKRFEFNCYSIKFLGYPITRILLIRYLTISISYILILLSAEII